MGLETKDLVSALSTATLANELPSKLVLMMESCITCNSIAITSAGHQVNHCMLSVVITVTDCLLPYMLQNETLLH